MNLDSLARTWGPRILAPLAFFTAATVLVLIVHRSLNTETAGSTPTTEAPTATQPQEATTEQTTTVPQQARRFYRIRQGDTLEAIAERFDTTVDDLLRLNPRIDPISLTPGQRIRVR